MLKKIITALIIIVAYLLQCTWINEIELAGITPNLLVMITFMYGFIGGKKYGMCVGFFCGLLVDIFYGYSGVVGINSLALLYIGYVNGCFNKMFYYEEISLPLVLIVISDICYNVFYCFITFMLRNKIDFGYYMLNIIIPETVYTVCVTVFLYRPFMKLYKLLDKKDKGSEFKVV